ncbi:hypothetical protein ABEB36_004858, partial [Hypothenemus hampei]
TNQETLKLILQKEWFKILRGVATNLVYSVLRRPNDTSIEENNIYHYWATDPVVTKSLEYVEKKSVTCNFRLILFKFRIMKSQVKNHRTLWDLKENPVLKTFCVMEIF